MLIEETHALISTVRCLSLLRPASSAPPRARGKKKSLRILWSKPPKLSLAQLHSASFLPPCLILVIVFPYLPCSSGPLLVTDASGSEPLDSSPRNRWNYWLLCLSHLLPRHTTERILDSRNIPLLAATIVLLSKTSPITVFDPRVGRRQGELLASPRWRNAAVPT